MNQNRFVKTLRKELPIWQEHGWVSAENSDAILEHVGTKENQINLLAFGVAILGVLLLGSGVITYFAANWAEMSKITKLLLLFGSMYATFAILRKYYYLAYRG